MGGDDFQYFPLQIVVSTPSPTESGKQFGFSPFFGKLQSKLFTSLRGKIALFKYLIDALFCNPLSQLSLGNLLLGNKGYLLHYC